MAKKVYVSMSPLMKVKEVGSNILNPTPAFNEVEYEKILDILASDATIKIPDFSDIDDGDTEDPALLIKKDPQADPNNVSLHKESVSLLNTYLDDNTFKDSVLETGTNIETPAMFERGANSETRHILETGIDNEASVANEVGITIETPTMTGRATKAKGANTIEIDINSIEREKLPIDCIRLEVVVRAIYKDKKLRTDGWIQISRDTLKKYKINGARLNETRLICKNRGTIDFKIENEGSRGKEKILYRPLN